MARRGRLGVPHGYDSAPWRRLLHRRLLGRPNSDERTFDVAIVGAGYVGLPLAQVFADAGRKVVLLDVSADRVAQILRGESYIEDVPSAKLAALVKDGVLHATTDYDTLASADAILIALPTPLSKQRGA